ncbi:PREDICTED: protein regulator of cytokinesis 1-like [Nanorana parkeri]|uniref:protein regulator of cytokinesis 1-like n=1 Tax=Nanorana parkeri TaxID=125878 RepID=UPI0008547F13|nr:PREDICTED: protein regulator of cytokinesis 1-like [Nanorana parkeri]
MSRHARKSEVLASSVISSANNALARLMDIWDGLGIKEEMRLQRIGEVRKHIEELFNRMITEEIEMKDRIEKSVQYCRREIKTLCHELSIEDYKVEEGMTILQIERDLRVRYEFLIKQKTDRLEELKLLQQKDQALCSDLCVTPYYIPSGCIPSNKQLEELKEHIRAQTEEKKKRLEVFSSLRAEIRQCLDEMGQKPENSLEQDAICEDDEAFFLTPENIRALTVLKEQLDLKKEALLSTLNSLKEKVGVLWDLLQISKEEREACQKISGNPIYEKIKVWENELGRLEEMKMANLKQVILKIRHELKTYWDNCFYSEEQREAFTPYYSDDFTEELLSKHDEEIVRMKLQYEKCKPIIDAIAKWETSWSQFIVLEKKASDPNRFSNRGGSLLKEEKERVKLQKLLSKLEEDLKARIEFWEEEQGCPFLFKGIKFMDYVASQWETFKQQKEREKQDRTQKKEDTVPFKTPIKRPAGSCTQNTPSNKTRKLNGTTNATISRTNVTTTFEKQTPAGKPQLATIKTPLKTKDTPVRTPLHDSNKQTILLSSQPASYSEFKEEISKKSTIKDAMFNSTINENV